MRYVWYVNVGRIRSDLIESHVENFKTRIEAQHDALYNDKNEVVRIIKERYHILTECIYVPTTEPTHLMCELIRL